VTNFEIKYIFRCQFTKKICEVYYNNGIQSLRPVYLHFSDVPKYSIFTKEDIKNWVTKYQSEEILVRIE